MVQAVSSLHGFIYALVSGCAGSSLLQVGFSLAAVASLAAAQGSRRAGSGLAELRPCCSVACESFCARGRTRVPSPSRWLLNHRAAREDPQEVFNCRNRTVLSILLRLFSNFSKGCMDICLDYENSVLVLLCPGPPQNPPFLTSSSTLS